MSRTVRMFVSLGLVALVVAALVIPAFADTTTATNTNTQTAVNVAGSTQTAAAVTGAAIAVNDSTAFSGDATTMQTVIQKQANLQISANAAVPIASPGNTTTATNTSTQGAANVAVADQLAGAGSGSAYAEDDSLAITGQAAVGQHAHQQQANAQVNVNAAVPILSPGGAATATNDSMQGSTNVAAAAQAGGAVTGHAIAIDDSFAQSGSAWVGQDAAQGQHSLQVNANVAAKFLAFGDTVVADNTNAQASLQGASIEQTLLGATGPAIAEDDSWAASGGVYPDQFNGQWQHNAQINVNAGVPLFAW